MTNLQTLSPAEIDEQLSALDEKLYNAKRYALHLQRHGLPPCRQDREDPMTPPYPTINPIVWAAAALVRCAAPAPGTKETT